MLLLAGLPLTIGILPAALGGLAAGAVVNWAVYGLAWNWRAISPWSRPHAEAPPRRPLDKVPVCGWFGLRREAELHGPRFWLRPIAVELSMSALWASLYWWEVARQGLVARQFAEVAAAALPNPVPLAPDWTTLCMFASHAILVTLMAAASLIDVDEKLVPDEITVTGTILGLILAVTMPMGQLPTVVVRVAQPVVGAAVPWPPGAAQQGQMYVEPTTFLSPNAWPDELLGSPRVASLAIGLGCWAVWCFALAPRIWRGRRDFFFTVRIVLARAARELARPPLVWIGLAGAIAIVGAWFAGGRAWVGMLSGLVGMLGAGAMVWAVRIAGSVALRREALGFGDVTLMMMVGTFLGWQAGVIIFFLAPFVAIVFAVLQLVFRRDDEIPYLPFLCLAALAVMVRWGDIWNDGPGSLQLVFGVGWLVPAVLAICVVVLGATLVVWRNIKEWFFVRGRP